LTKGSDRLDLIQLNRTYYEMSPDSRNLWWLASFVGRGKIGANWIGTIIGSIVILGGIWLYDEFPWVLPYFFAGIGFLLVFDFILFLIRRKKAQNKGIPPIDPDYLRLYIKLTTPESDDV
jgi:sugar phosphate permease